MQKHNLSAKRISHAIRANWYSGNLRQGREDAFSIFCIFERLEKLNYWSLKHKVEEYRLISELAATYKDHTYNEIIPINIYNYTNQLF